MARPPAPPLRLSKKERAELEGIAASVSLPHRAVREAKGLLMAGDGVANTSIAETLGVSRSTIYAMMRAGALRTAKAGARRLVPAAELNRLLSDLDDER